MIPVKLDQTLAALSELILLLISQVSRSNQSKYTELTVSITAVVVENNHSAFTVNSRLKLMILNMNKSFVCAHYHCQLTVSHRKTVQLLFVKVGYLTVACLSQADITYAIDSICTSWCVRCFMFDVIFYSCTSCTIL